jgi:NitT/TauT family transport system ATP-binding protein
VIEPPLIEVRAAGVELGGRPILSGIDLTLRRGEFVCLLGPSGCGKTTLLRVLGGLITPSRGSVLFHGAPVREPPREVAIVFQDYSKALMPWRSAAGNVSLSLEAIGIPAVERPAKIAPNFPAACNSACKSRERSLSNPTCCLWMNRSGHSTP